MGAVASTARREALSIIRRLRSEKLLWSGFLDGGEPWTRGGMNDALAIGA